MGVAKSGRYIALFNPTKAKAITDSGNLKKGTWYEIIEKGPKGASVFDPLKVGHIFRSAHTADEALQAGDKCVEITLGESVALTECTMAISQDNIDVTDNQSGGYTAFLPTGFSDLAGTITRFTKFRDDGQIETYSSKAVNRFIDVINDDGAGNRTLSEAENKEFLAFICMNSEVEADKDEYQNWLITNIVVNSYDFGGAVRDAIKGDMAYQKGEGKMSIYRRKVGTGDGLDL